MRDVEKNRLVAGVVDRHVDFELALTGYRRRYPIHEFQSLVAAVRGYIRATREDKMIHRGVVGAVHGLAEYLRVERKRVPDEVLSDAERLECPLSLAYDPYFEGHEPPGL
jgi:hypothetical protein